MPRDNDIVLPTGADVVRTPAVDNPTDEQMQALETMANGGTVEVDHGEGKEKDYLTTDPNAAQEIEDNPQPQPPTEPNAPINPEDAEAMLAIPENVRNMLGIPPSFKSWKSVFKSAMDSRRAYTAIANEVNKLKKQLMEKTLKEAEMNQKQTMDKLMKDGKISDEELIKLEELYKENPAEMVKYAAQLHKQMTSNPSMAELKAQVDQEMEILTQGMSPDAKKALADEMTEIANRHPELKTISEIYQKHQEEKKQRLQNEYLQETMGMTPAEEAEFSDGIAEVFKNIPELSSIKEAKELYNAAANLYDGWIAEQDEILDAMTDEEAEIELGKWDKIREMYPNVQWTPRLLHNQAVALDAQDIVRQRMAEGKQKKPANYVSGSQYQPSGGDSISDMLKNPNLTDAQWEEIEKRINGVLQEAGTPYVSDY